MPANPRMQGRRRGGITVRRSSPRGRKFAPGAKQDFSGHRSPRWRKVKPSWKSQQADILARHRKYVWGSPAATAPPQKQSLGYHFIGPGSGAQSGPRRPRMSEMERAYRNQAAYAGHRARRRKSRSMFGGRRRGSGSYAANRVMRDYYRRRGYF